MAAGLGFKTFTTGEVLTAGDVNGYLMQGVLVFASTAARDAAITSPQEGQFAYTKDTNGLWYYDGAAWVASGATGDIEGVTAGVGISGGGTSGTVTVTNSMATAITTKGDLVVGTGSGTFQRQAVGANGTVLTADSAEADGVKWAAVAGGGMTLLSTTTLSGATTTISSIDQTYTNLFAIITSMTNNTADGAFRVGINGATNGHDGVVSRFEQGGSATLSGFANNYIITPSNLARANSTNTFVLLLPAYSNTANAVWKTFNMFGRYTSSTASTPISISGMYGDTSAITSLAFSNSGGNLAGGTVLLYGVK
jgi:hypothetical protein